MHHVYALDWRAGWLCVREDSVLWTAPARQSIWYPVAQMARVDAVGRIDEPVVPHLAASGVFVRADGRTVTLVHGGVTEALDRAETPIPPPRTHRPVRWQDGRWQERRARGWETLP